MGSLTMLDAIRGLYFWNLVIAQIAIGLLALVAARWLRRHRPLVRYRVACYAQAALLASPVLLAVASSLELRGVAVEVTLPADSGDPIQAPFARHNVASGSRVPGETTPDRTLAASAVTASPDTSTWLRRLSGVLACVWLCGSLLVALELLRAMLICRRLRNGAQLAADPRLLTLLERACDAAQLDYRVQLAISPVVPGPLSLGIWRPTILLPQDMAERLSDDELLCVLTHEAAHVVRHDAAVAWLQQLSRCLFWWNPWLGVLHRQLNQTREQICDDYVVRAHAAGETLAQVLVKLAEWRLAEPRQPRLAGTLRLDAELPIRISRLIHGDSHMHSCLNRRSLFALALLTLVGSVFALVPVFGVVAQASQKASPAAKKSPPARLSYNDGTAEGKKSIAGAAEFVSFTAPGEGAKVSAIRVHGARYGYPQPPKEDIEIYFLGADGREKIATKQVPYSRFKRGQESWVEVKFPQPVEVPKEFWVGLNFNAERTKGVYLSVDKSTDGSHSRVGLPGEELREANVNGDWMIEAVLAE